MIKKIAIENVIGVVYRQNENEFLTGNNVAGVFKVNKKMLLKLDDLVKVDSFTYRYENLLIPFYVIDNLLYNIEDIVPYYIRNKKSNDILIKELEDGLYLYKSRRNYDRFKEDAYLRSKMFMLESFGYDWEIPNEELDIEYAPTPDPYFILSSNYIKKLYSEYAKQIGIPEPINFIVCKNMSKIIAKVISDRELSLDSSDIHEEVASGVAEKFGITYTDIDDFIREFAVTVLSNAREVDLISKFESRR